MPKGQKRSNQSSSQRRQPSIPRRNDPSRSHGRMTRSPQSLPPDATARLLEALAKIPGGATGHQIAAAMSLGPSAGRDIAQTLRQLVEQGQVLEVRPGRYQVSGSGGEYSVLLEPALPGAAHGVVMQATFPDGRILPVHPRHSLGSKAGDVCQAMIGEDDFVLITRVIRRTGREVVGTVNFRPQGLVFVPDNRREGEMPVLGTFSDFHTRYQAGDRVLGAIEVDPSGRTGVTLSRILGKDSPEITDFTFVCVTHDLPDAHLREVEEQAAAVPKDFPPGEREDLREKLVFTIDPVTAKDFDDAISLERRPEGGWIVGVHIADVSHYVRDDGTPLDTEAACRGTSIYLINRVIPMLPEVLSNGLCSLVPNEDRYTLSVFLEIDQHLKLVGKRCSESIIRSRHRLTYEQALEILEKKDAPGQWPKDLVDTVRTVGDIAQGLRKGRERAGALNLYSVEHRFTLDVNGMPVEVSQETSDVSHQLIEECMLLANRAVAEWLESKGFPCVYRIHAKPDEDRLGQFVQILEAYGIDGTNVFERFGLQAILKRLDQEPRAAKLVLNFMCLRSFKKAVYAVENIGHYALAFESYAHFTSPIRRYPDLLVHRLVKRALGLRDYKSVEMRPSYLDALAKQSSYLEQRAELAERTLHARKSARYLSLRIGETFPGVVTGATGGALFVQMMETGMEGMLPVRELTDDYYEYDNERMALVGSRSGRVFGPGAEIDIRVISVDIERADVTFGLAPDEIDLNSKASASGGGRHSKGAPPGGKHQAEREDKRKRKEGVRSERKAKRRR